MKKYTLPIIISNGLVLLPTNSVRLEFEETGLASNIVESAEMFHDNLLAFSLENNGIGVLSKIESKIKLPNGNIRVDIKGIRRIRILDYIKDSGLPYEAIVCDIEKHILKIEKEEAYKQRIINELDIFLKNSSNTSPQFIEQIKNTTCLADLIDTTVVSITSDQKNLVDCLNALDINERMEKFFEIIYKEKEIFKLDKKIDLKVKKELDDTQKQYIIKEKIKLMKEELGENSKDSKVDILKEKIQKLKCPKKVREKLLYELSRFETSSNFSPETNILEEYINWVISLPWNRMTKDNNDFKTVKQALNDSHYGLEKVKERIIEYLVVKSVNNNSSKTPIICLVGPPGVGKTSLAKSIASSINRKFAKISVGGLTDEHELIGHRKTYVGAMPGRIISSLKKVNCLNPVILIDEVDKMGSEHINNPSNCLLNILDYEQNKNFSDNYIEEEFDISNVMFILTANYIEDIPAPLLDRLEIIELSSYTEYEKLDIVKKHLLPKICLENGLDISKINIDDNGISYIIRHYAKEAGVRELERQISKIIRKIVTQLVINNIKIHKINLTEMVIEKYLGKIIYQNKSINKEANVGIVNGLAYTYFGGDVLPIEVTMYQGDGQLILTGSLGEVMKESASIAFSYIKSNYQFFGINYDLFQNNIHIHVPEGAVKKDGPSAGVALTLVLVSLFTNKKIPSNIALTGEITLRGNVLPIGGLKEKSIGALKAQVKTVFIPANNEKDLEDIPNEVKENLNFILVNDFMEVFKTIFKN